MIALIQRVSHACVVVDDSEIAKINQGLLVLLGVERGDNKAKADKLLNKVIGYRVFEDEAGKMNLSLKDTGGGLLLVPQFTLAAETTGGLRPSFSSAAVPVEAETWFNYMVKQGADILGAIQAGRFAADMKVSLLNDGPVTFWLQT